MEAAEESVGWGKLDMGSAEPREPEPEPEPHPPAGLPGEPEPEPEEGVPPEEVGYWEAEGIPGVVLYDEHTRSRQKGRLQITRSQLSFYPASGGGRPVSFPLESVQSAKRAEKGGRFKVEARVLVPRQEKSAAIAFEFDDRRRERDDALRAMSKEDGLFGRQSLFDGAEFAAAAAAQTGEIRVGAVLRDSRRANRPEQVQLTLGTDKITFEPASGGETATLTLAQLRRIKSSEADSGLFATATAGIDLVRGSISRLSGFTLGSAAAAPPPSSVELRFAIATDERAPNAICTLDFETDELRDQLVIQLQQRWSVVKRARAEAEAAAARDDFGLSVVSTAVRDVVPELVSIVSTLKTEGGTKVRYVVECEAGGSKWHVVKRYQEFFALREQLLACEPTPPIEDVPFPPKTWSIGGMDTKMFERRRQLDPWLSRVIKVCTPSDDDQDRSSFAAAAASAPVDFGGRFTPFGGGDVDFGGGFDPHLPAPSSQLPAAGAGGAPLLPSPAGALLPAPAGAALLPPPAPTANPRASRHDFAAKDGRDYESACALLEAFFSVEEVRTDEITVAPSTPGSFRATAGTGGAALEVQWPVEPEDPTTSLEAILPALPTGVNCELLERLGGGPAKQGWMYLETTTAGGKIATGWIKRWFVLWPSVAHHKYGHLLFSFVKKDSFSADVAIQLIQPVIRAPKTERADYYSVRLNANQITAIRPHAAGVTLTTASRKFILGMDAEDGDDGIRAWIGTLRGAGPDWRDKQEVDAAAWLLKKGGTMGLWSRRWVELRGRELLHYESAGNHPAGCWNLTEYTLCLPQLPEAHREFEFIVVPTGALAALAEAAANGAPSPDTEGIVYHCFSAATTGTEDDKGVFDLWRRALEKLMPVATPDQMAVLPAIVGQWGLLATLGRSFSGTPDHPGMMRPDDFDVMRLIGTGGFGKVFLVKKRDIDDAPLLAMKVMDKAKILEQAQEDHINEEKQLLTELHHPFIVGPAPTAQVLAVTPSTL